MTSTIQTGPRENGSAPKPLLEVENLRVSFQLAQRTIDAVRGVSFAVQPGEAVGILGESGSGKSVTGRALMGILKSPPALVTADRMHFRGTDLDQLRQERRGSDGSGQPIAMIFQNPFTALNPVFRVGNALTEVLVSQRGMTAAQARTEAVRLLDAVRIPNASRRIKSYPHEFSGGMQQRIMIALALALNPDVLIADEPTTALDVTVQAQILTLLRELQQERQMGLIFISHDLDVVSEVVTRVYVMYGGRIVESGPVDSIYADSRHPYTRGLLLSAPTPGVHKKRLVAIAGSPPEAGATPPGCPFHPRCPHQTEVCREEMPPLSPSVDGPGVAACHHAAQLPRLEVDTHV
ncbi:ABC transporter ATP-binding protein [Kribbella qitaiheensis]|uniref:ABC transporter ATP-binding protein n=1 Tax=Kribbella qitaiheensis TaxID=1544730 RepID=UPI0036220646